MKYQLFVCVVLTVFLSGCTTTKIGSSTGNLQIKVNHLERRLNQQDQEIDELKIDIEEINTRFGKNIAAESVSGLESLKDVDVEEAEEVKGDGENILRVPVSIKTLQQALATSGFYEGAIDGKLGPATKRSIRNFQKEHDLEVDGIVGQQTWGELKYYLE